MTSASGCPGWLRRGDATAAGGLLIALVLGFASGAAAQTVGDRDWPSSRPPGPLTAREVTFPPFEIRTLANGLQVVSVAHHEQPAVSLRLLVKAGAAQDPAGRGGVAHLVASLLDQGSTARGAGAIAEAIDTRGGVLEAGAGTDLTYVSVVVMRDSFEFGLDLLSEVVRTPAFTPEEIARQREQLLSSLRVSYQDPDYVAAAVIDRLTWGFHTYGQPNSGTPASVAAVTRDDLVAFHQTWFSPANTILAVVGDVKAEEAFAQVERAFGAWPRRDVPEVRPTEPPAPTRRVIVVDRPGAVQTEIRLGNLAIPRKHPDYLAFDLAVRVLGGEGANRLQRVLRTQHGLTYSASADARALKQGGSIVAETDTRSEATGEALRLAVDELWRLQRERVHPLELADAKDYLTGNFPLTLETPGAIATQVLNSLFYELDVKELETLRERVNAISVDQLQRVAQMYLFPARLSVVLVGDARVIVPQVQAAGFTELEIVPLHTLDLAAVDFGRGASPSGRP
jgi:zinc protease